MYQLEGINWLALGVVIVFVAVVLHAALPMLTGLICAWRMEHLSVRRGLAMGGIAVVVSVLLNAVSGGSILSNLIGFILPTVAT